MTVSSQQSYVEYNADGSTTTFTVPFYFLLGSDLAVTVEASDGTTTDLTYGVNFSVTGEGNASGGNITTNVIYPTGSTILILRSPPATQETAYAENGKFPAKSHEKALDKLTMLVQRWNYWWDNLALKKPNFFSSYYDASQNRIANLADPGADQDAINKRTALSFIESAVAGVVGGFGWFLQSGAGAISRTFQSKMRDQISALDFTMNADGATDDTANFAILEAVYTGRVVNLCGKSYKVAAPPTLNTYVDGTFISNSLDTGLPVSLVMGNNAAIISSTTDTGAYEARYLNPLTGDYQPSGRSTKDLYTLVASQNSRSAGPARAANVASIYSVASGNISGNYSSRQGTASVPQSVNIGSEDCRVDQGFRGSNLSSITSHVTGETGVNLGSRRGWSTAMHTVNIASVDAYAGGGRGAVLKATVNSSGVITAVTIVSAGTGYSSAGSVKFYDRLSVPTSDAAATYTIDPSTGALTGVTLTSGGSGYSTVTNSLYETVQVTLLEAGNYSANLATANNCATYGELSFNIGANNSSAKANRSGNIAVNACSTSAQYAFNAGSTSAVSSATYAINIGSATVTSSGVNSGNYSSSNATASGTRSVNIATDTSTNSGVGSVILGGGGNSITADGAVVLAGNNSTADLTGLILMGRRTKGRTARSIVYGDSGTGSAATANIKFEMLPSGALNIAGALTQNVTFTDIAKMFENSKTGEIPVGSLVSWDGRKVRTAKKGDVNFSVHSRTYAMLLGDSQFTWADRYLRDEWGQIIYQDIPDPDWTEMIPDPDWPVDIKDNSEPEYQIIPLVDVNGNETGEYQKVLVQKVMIPNPEPAPLIPNPIGQGVVTVPVENPDFDPDKQQIPRSERKDDWTPVALAGEIHTRVDASVGVDDYVEPSDVDGIGTKASGVTRLRCMEIRQAYDADEGYAIALCLRD